MNRKQAFDALEEIAGENGIKIENCILPDGDWFVSSQSFFRVVELHGYSMIYLGPHRVASVTSEGRRHVIQAETIAAKANQRKMEVIHV